MGRAKSSGQRTTAAKKSNGTARSSGTKKSGRLAALLVAGVLVAAIVASWAARKWTAPASSPTASITPASRPAPGATEPPQTEDGHVSAAEMMMGGDPSKQFNPGERAVQPKLASGASALTTPASVSGFEGLIALDPVCETVEPPTRRFAPGNPAPSTRRMAERLVNIRDTMHPSSASYLNDRMADMLQGHLTSATELNEKFRLQFQLAIQQINAARPDSALNTFSSMERLLAESGGQLDERTRAELRLRKGVAFFRLGEQENCLATHNADSCVFPLKPKAYHLLPRGSRGAIAMFSAHLAEYPNDFSTRWLLNLAHMTLGEYPEKVNPQYIIPPEKFASDYDMPRFFDVSDGLGIDANDLAGGCIVDDFDNDGFYDLVISAWDLQGQLRYFHNNGDGKFTERTSEAGLVGMVGSLNIQQTDYNNDGLLDLWLLRGAWLAKAGRIPNSLMRNNGDGTFTDVTEEAGLLSFHPTQASRWFDFDGDGWLDVFIGNESTNPQDPDFCELYRNNRNGTFTECAKAVGINVAQFVKGVACADYDNDGRPDLYLSIRGNVPKILLHNDGPDSSGQWRFSDTAAKARVDNRILSFATFFFDYDNDGGQDLFLSGYSLPNGVGDIAAEYLGLPNKGEKPRLYHNNLDGTFSNVTVEAGLHRICHTMGHNYGDLDNDGWLDFYCGHRRPGFQDADSQSHVPKRERQILPGCDDRDRHWAYPEGTRNRLRGF